MFNIKLGGMPPSAPQPETKNVRIQTIKLGININPFQINQVGLRKMFGKNKARFPMTFTKTGKT